MKYGLFLLLVCAALLPETGMGQTRTNPEVTIIGDFRTSVQNSVNSSGVGDELKLELSEAELDISGYLNPYATAWATFAWNEEENAEIEELYVTFLRGLPFDANLRIGKYLLEFGRLNPLHVHAYSFMNRPFPQAEYFGEEGLRDMALRLSFLLPTGEVFTEIAGALLSGEVLMEELPPDTSILLGMEEDESVSLGYFGRITSSLAVSENAELALGFSGLSAVYEPQSILRVWIAGSDLKYRWKPSRYTSLTVEAEFLMNRRDTGTGEKVVSYGAYGYFDYRFRQRYNIGAIAEYAQAKYDSNIETWRASGFVGFAPVEETSLIRLVGNWTKPASGSGFWTLSVQLVFSLGPHQAHNF